MEIWTPCIVVEIIHRDPEWHDFKTPRLLGHYANEQVALDVLNESLATLCKEFDDAVYNESSKCRKDTRCEISYYYPDRCITVLGYLYHGRI